MLIRALRACWDALDPDVSFGRVSWQPLNRVGWSMSNDTNSNFALD